VCGSGLLWEPEHDIVTVHEVDDVNCDPNDVSGEPPARALEFREAASRRPQGANSLPVSQAKDLEPLSVSRRPQHDEAVSGELGRQRSLCKMETADEPPVAIDHGERPILTLEQHSARIHRQRPCDRALNA